MNNDELIIFTLDTIRDYFAAHFGTYRPEDTVKITEVFEVINEFKERFTERCK